MTEAQASILDKIHDQLAEHFPSHVLAVTYDATNGADKKEMIGKAVYWGGGVVGALGVADYAHEVIKRRCFDGDPDEVEGEEQ